MKKFVKNIYVRILAFLCNKSMFILEFTRNHNIKSKGEISKYLHNKEEITAKCNGINYRLNLSDDIQQQIYLNVYEKNNVEFILGLLNHCDTFFDAGANVGAYTLQAAKKLNTGENIYSFEPEPDNFTRLDHNCSINEFSKKVNRLQIALTNKTGNAILFKSDNKHSGWHSLTEFKDISIDKTEVTTDTLDNFVMKNNIKKIDLIKIDVEANEFELLEGAKNCLKEKILKKVYIEFNGPRLSEKNKTFTEFTNLFADYGYIPKKINLELANELSKGKLKYEEICENFLFEPD